MFIWKPGAKNGQKEKKWIAIKVQKQNYQTRVSKRRSSIVEMHLRDRKSKFEPSFLRVDPVEVLLQSVKCYFVLVFILERQYLKCSVVI